MVSTQIEQHFLHKSYTMHFQPEKKGRNKHSQTSLLETNHHEFVPQNELGAPAFYLGVACKLRRGLVPAPSTSNAPESCEKWKNPNKPHRKWGLNLPTWWLNHPFEKYARQIRSFPQAGVEIKHIWNHHSRIDTVSTGLVCWEGHPSY